MAVIRFRKLSSVFLDFLRCTKMLYVHCLYQVLQTCFLNITPMLALSSSLLYFLLVVVPTICWWPPDPLQRHCLWKVDSVEKLSHSPLAGISIFVLIFPSVDCFIYVFIGAILVRAASLTFSELRSRTAAGTSTNSYAALPYTSGSSKALGINPTLMFSLGWLTTGTFHFNYCSHEFPQLWSWCVFGIQVIPFNLRYLTFFSVIFTS